MFFCSESSFLLRARGPRPKLYSLATQASWRGLKAGGFLLSQCIPSKQNIAMLSGPGATEHVRTELLSERCSYGLSRCVALKLFSPTSHAQSPILQTTQIGECFYGMPPNGRHANFQETGESPP